MAVLWLSGTELIFSVFVYSDMMATSVREDLRRDLGCLDLLGCIHGLNERGQMAFQLLQQAVGRLTVDDVADRLDCERTTAYRSVSRLPWWM